MKWLWIASCPSVCFISEPITIALKISRMPTINFTIATSRRIIWKPVLRWKGKGYGHKVNIFAAHSCVPRCLQISSSYAVIRLALHPISSHLFHSSQLSNPFLIPFLLPYFFPACNNGLKTAFSGLQDCNPFASPSYWHLDDVSLNVFTGCGLSLLC